MVSSNKHALDISLWLHSTSSNGMPRRTAMQDELKRTADQESNQLYHKCTYVMNPQIFGNHRNDSCNSESCCMTSGRILNCIVFAQCESLLCGARIISFSWIRGSIPLSGSKKTFSHRPLGVNKLICHKATPIFIVIEHTHTTALCYFTSVPFLSLLFSKMYLEISDIIVGLIQIIQYGRTFGLHRTLWPICQGFREYYCK